MSNAILKSKWLNSPLGPMLAVADEHQLHLLEFEESGGLKREIFRLQQYMQSTITPGITAPIQLIENELKKYFSGNLQNFTTPISTNGTSFQNQVWKALTKIPYGKTLSYGDLAKKLGKPTAFRAAANANGRNQLSIIIPCHRVINTSGALGGYDGGVARKQWLLEHESAYG